MTWEERLTPMAKRSLEWTYFERESFSNFGFFLIAVPFSFYRSNNASNLEKVIAFFVTGFVFGLLSILASELGVLCMHSYFYQQHTVSSCFAALIIRGMPKTLSRMQR